ncbi:hypothetical protein FOA52_001243 [Chlamydomonas sp. UWO 241]|nr:hypothetical protein FOA52_001243 [Chlamydomonas sp. UWO 241]
MRSGADDQVDVAAAPAVNGVDAQPVPSYPPAYNPYAYGAPPTADQHAQYQQQMMAQGGDPRQQQYQQYGPPPPGYFPYAPPPGAVQQQASGGMPWFVWVVVGMGAAFAVSKVQEFTKKGPQAMMSEMMMKQAMGAMSKGGGMPGMPPGMGMPPGFGGAPGGGASPFGAGSPFAAATAAGGAGGAAAAPWDVTPSKEASAKFEANKAAAAKAAEAPVPKKSMFTDVVEPSSIKEPGAGGASSSGNNGEKKAPQSAFFSDVTPDAASAPRSGSPFGGMPPGMPGMPPGMPGMPPGMPPGFPGSGGAPGGGDPVASDSMMQMMETMLRNPEMQKMLYPYLPEPMRNPSSIEWMLSNPEVKQQMATMFEQQNMMSPQMMDMMKGMDFNSDKVNAQFSELGLKPEDVISKVMSTPDLAAGFSNPKVQAAIIDISQNPMNIMKYQNDPEIMKVLEKVTEVFQPAGGMPGGMPGMPKQ